MLRLSYMSKKDRTLGFILMLFPLYIIYGFIILDTIIRVYFGGKLHFTVTGTIIIIVISVLLISYSYWYNFSCYYNFFLDRKSRKIVFSKGEIIKEYSIDNVIIKTEFNKVMGRAIFITLIINGDKYILRPGNLFKRNLWDTMLNQDKLAKEYANRIKNILGITDTTK